MLIYANSLFNAPDDQGQESFGPADLYFNDSFVGQPAPGETKFLTGDWGRVDRDCGYAENQARQLGITLDARFQRTRMPTAPTPSQGNDEQA